MESKLRNLIVSAVCVAAYTVGSAAVEAGTFLRVHVQPSPNVYAARVTFLNSNGPYLASKTIAPGDKFDWFLPNDKYVIVVFNQDTREVIATEEFSVTDSNPPTTAAWIWRDVNNNLELSWGDARSRSFEEAFGGKSPRK